MNELDKFHKERKKNISLMGEDSDLQKLGLKLSPSALHDTRKPFWLQFSFADCIFS